MAGPVLGAHNHYAGRSHSRREMHSTRIITNIHRASRQGGSSLSWRQYTSRVSPFAPNSDQSICWVTILRTAKDDRMDVALLNQSASQFGESLFRPHLGRPFAARPESY